MSQSEVFIMGRVPEYGEYEDGSILVDIEGDHIQEGLWEQKLL